ncbi:MAG: hypothetical protein QME78_03295, partial [Thermodesulfobacteriota bacterium]|nr:hypothetical protein [Thermodesulfobacteriota bacterium]
ESGHGPDGRGNLSGAQGRNSFMGKGGASAEDALPSFDPAFSLRKKSTGYGPIFFPPVLPLSSPSRPGFVYHCEFINLFKSDDLVKSRHSGENRSPGYL